MLVALSAITTKTSFVSITMSLAADHLLKETDLYRCGQQLTNIQRVGSSRMHSMLNVVIVPIFCH